MSDMRAGDADRQLAIENLTQAWRAGRLSREEFQQRSQQTMSATYTSELEELLADVGGLSQMLRDNGTQATYQGLAVPADAEVVQDSWQSEPDENLPVQYAPEGASGAAISIGIMSGMDRVGTWVVAPTHVAFGFWGGATLDLRNAVFTSAETTITCIAIMGGIEVIVPPEMDVKVSGIGFMGGFGWQKLRHAQPSRTPTPDAPRVTINGLGFWGGVEIIRKRRDEPIDE